MMRAESGLIGVVADDLTGACDTAAQFRRTGARVAVVLDGDGGETPLPDGYDVLTLTTESRRILATQAALRTRAAVGRLRAAGAKRFYIKVDSVLRGSPGGIIEGAAMECGVPYVLVAPAFPAQGRTVVGGWVRRDDNAVVDGMAKLRETAIASIGHIPLRSIRSSMTAIAIAPGLLSDTIALLLADSERDEDLWTLAEYATSTDLPLVAGSAGLARMIAPFWCWDAADDADEDDTDWAERDGGVLVVVGTRNPRTQAQLALLSGDTYGDAVAVVMIAPDAPDDALPKLREAFQTSPIVVAALNVPQDTPVTDNALTGLARVIVALVAERRDNLSGIIATGGATALAICQAAAVRLLRVVDEVMPGVPCSVMEDGALAGVPLVTKSGGFGDDEALIASAIWLLGGFDNETDETGETDESGDEDGE